MFAIEDVEPRIGKIATKQVYWGNNKEKKKYPVELVNCKELLPGGSHEGRSSNSDFLLEKLQQSGREKVENYLCPVDIQSLSLHGHYGSETFNYFEIKLTGC